MAAQPTIFGHRTTVGSVWCRAISYSCRALCLMMSRLQVFQRTRLCPGGGMLTITKLHEHQLAWCNAMTRCYCQMLQAHHGRPVSSLQTNSLEYRQMSRYLHASVSMS